MLVTLDTLTFTGADGDSVDMYITLFVCETTRVIYNYAYVKSYVHIRGIYMHVHQLLGLVSGFTLIHS